MSIGTAIVDFMMSYIYTWSLSIPKLQKNSNLSTIKSKYDFDVVKVKCKCKSIENIRIILSLHSNNQLSPIRWNTHTHDCNDVKCIFKK